MRCALCDRIAIPQVLARTPDGLLVFGWCPECLRREGCEPVEAEGAALAPAAPEPLGRRWRRLGRTLKRRARRPPLPSPSRRLAALGIAGLMAAWALILAFVGGWKLTASPGGNGILLLVGSGLTAILSLMVWIGVIGRGDGAGMVLKVVQVAAAIVAFGTLGWGVVRHEAAQAPTIVLIALAALGISWAAHRVDRLRHRARPRRAIAKP